MKRIVTLGLLLGALLLVGCSVGQGTTATPTSAPKGEIEGPRIAFDAESVDLGKVPLDTLVSHTFTFSNVGNEPLTVANVQVRTLEGC